jgi:uncharacterized protein (TIGR02271 family)
LNKHSQQKPSIIVVDQDGVPCAVASPTTSDHQGFSQMLLQFNSGQQVVVPQELLRRQESGDYRLTYRTEEVLAQFHQVEPEIFNSASSHHTTSDTVERAAEGQEIVVPITEEQVIVQRQITETGRVQIEKSVREHIRHVDQPVIVEEVVVERVAVNRVLEEAVAPRYEGETLIIPLVEEVLIVQKQLVLREEVHITKVRREVQQPQEVRLRSEEVKIVRHPSSEAYPDSATM